MNTLGANHRKRLACPNIEQLAKQIAESEGKQRSKIWELIDGKPSFFAKIHLAI